MITHNEVLQQVNTVFRDILDNEEVTVDDNSTADDVEEWDSLTHIQLVVGVEKQFKIRFTSSEIGSFKNVGEMCEGILKKLAAK
jgi:acyl carrier protein